MSEEISGFPSSPRMQVQAAFEEIARRSMHALSFLHPNMPVYVSDFTLFEGQWTGSVIAPWMLSALIFPAPISSGRYAKSVKNSDYVCRMAQ